MAGMGPGPRRVQGPKPKVENAGKIFGRLLKMAFKGRVIRWLIVVACILTTVYTMTIQGTLFTKTLIDGYITPLLDAFLNGGTVPDYSGLLHEIVRIGILVLIGASAAFIQQRVMVSITQGFQQQLRDEMFDHMESLPIKYFDTQPIIVEAGIKTGIRIATENPKQIGADRIVDAAGAYELYGGPVLVLDFGTATTYDLVDANGAFVSGVTRAINGCS